MMKNINEKERCLRIINIAPLLTEHKADFVADLP